MSRRLAVLLSFSLAGLLVAGSPSPAHAQDIGFRRSVMKLEPGEAPSPVYAIVEVASPSRDTASSLAIEDAGGEGPPGLTVTFLAVSQLPPSADTSYWRVLVTVAGIEPGSRLARTASVSLDGGQTGTLVDYTLDNVTEFSWELVPPPRDLVLGSSLDERTASLTVKTGDTPLTGLRIVQSTLQDETTKRQLGRDDVVLADTVTQIGPRTSRQLRIQVPTGFTQPGAFKGSVVFGVDQGTETKSIDLTVYSSPRRLRWLGLLLIGAGLFVSVFVSVYVKNRTFRYEALLAASDLLRELGPLDVLLGTAEQKADPRKVATLRQWSNELHGDLSEGALDRSRVLPGRFRNHASEELAKRLAAYLGDRAAKLAILDEIIGRGVAEVLRYWDSDPVKAAEALEKLNKEAVKGATLDKVRQAVTDILKGVPHLRSLGWVPARGAESVTRSLELLGLSVWVIWLFITAVGGYGALIYSNWGFGTVGDLITAFFWGLGLPMAGQSLQQLTPGKFAAQLNLPLPRGN